MSDPTKAEPRYATGETAQEAVDRMAGGGQGAPHPSTTVTARPPGPNTHPSSTHTYGSPVGMPILKGGS